MNIVGSSFVFNIFFCQSPAPHVYQPNFHIFKDLILSFPHRAFPNSPLTYCLFINIVALLGAFIKFRLTA